MSAGRSTNADRSLDCLLSCALSPGCEMAATTSPASTSTWAVSRWPRKLPVRPWEMTLAWRLICSRLPSSSTRTRRRCACRWRPEHARALVGARHCRQSGARGSTVDAADLGVRFEQDSLPGDRMFRYPRAGGGDRGARAWRGGSVQVAEVDGRRRELATYDGPRIQIVQAGLVAECVDVDVPKGIAWEGIASAFVEERSEAQFVARCLVRVRRRSRHFEVPGELLVMPRSVLVCTKVRQHDAPTLCLLQGGVAREARSAARIGLATGRRCRRTRLRPRLHWLSSILGDEVSTRPACVVPVGPWRNRWHTCRRASSRWT